MLEKESSDYLDWKVLDNKQISLFKKSMESKKSRKSDYIDLNTNYNTDIVINLI